MNDPTIYVCFLVHGAPVYAQFRDAGDLAAWYDVERTSFGKTLRQVQGQDGVEFLLRPSAVDAVFEGRRMSDAN